MFFEPSTSTIHPTIQHYAAAHPEAAGLDTEAGAWLLACTVCMSQPN